MDTEWDQNKAIANYDKHGIDFADAVATLEDPSAITIDDVVDGEDRYITLGLDVFGRILVIVYTWRGEAVRLISARKANKEERRQYEVEL